MNWSIKSVRLKCKWICFVILSAAALYAIHRYSAGNGGTGQAPSASVRSLRAVVGAHALPTGINDAGQIVGEYQGVKKCAVLWQLKPSIAPESMERFAQAYGINGNGQIAGAVRTETGELRAAIDQWDGIRLLAPALGTGSRAEALNNHGDAVGAYWSESSSPRAFLWLRDCGAIDLSSLTGKTVHFARGINGSGVVVGQCTNEDTSRAFVWSAVDGLVPLDDHGADRSAANGINNQGQIVGHFRIGQRQCACMWDRDRNLIDLHDLLPNLNRWQLHSATAINDRGQIIGRGVLEGVHQTFLMELKFTEVIDLE